jgi:hypothetical protein
MSTKQQVILKAQKTNCELRVDQDEVSLYAPEGFTLGEYHIVSQIAERGYLTKADIYDELIDLMDDLRRCPSDCTH